jgi:hypothetical protein
MDSISNRNNVLLFSALSVLALLRIGMVAGFLMDMPHIEHSGWQFHCGGGDQALYFNMAKSFADLHPIHEKYPIGFPLLLAPLVSMYNAHVWQDLIKPVMVIHTMLAILSIYLVGYITRMVTRKISVSIICALAWILVPYVLCYFSGFFNAPWLRNTYVSYTMWFAMLSEPSTTFFLLLNIYLYFKSLEKESLPWLAGIIAGITISIRIASAIYVLIFAAGYMLRRKYRDAVLFIAVISIILIPQLAYNLHFNHGLFTFGYTTIDATAIGREVLFSFAFTLSFINFILSFINYLVSMHPFVFCSLLAFALIAPVTIFYAFRTARYQWGVLLGLVAIHILFYSAWWAFVNDFIRYVMPIIPVVIIISGGVIVGLQEWLRPRYVRKH